MLVGQGIIKVDLTNKRIVVDVDLEFAMYYRWFVRKEFMIDPQLPYYGCHITIANDELYPDAKYNKIKKYHNRKILFHYDEDMYIGGQSKGFKNFYLKIYSDLIDKIKFEMDIVEPEDYKGVHITIANTKAGERIYLPPIITLK